MKRRSTDDHDEITEVEVKQARINWFKAMRLFLMNLPTIYKVVALVIALVTGTIAAPEVIHRVSEIAGGEATIPAGQTLTPDPAAPSVVWQGQVDISLTSQKAAIDVNTADIEAIRGAMDELEKRLASQRSRGDNTVEGKVIANSERLSTLESIIQP